MMTTARFDAVAVNIETSKVRIFERGASYKDAEAVCKMAIMRRGLDEEFYSVTPTLMYEAGDTFTDNGGATDPNPPGPDARIVTIGGMGFPVGPRGLER